MYCCLHNIRDSIGSLSGAIKPVYICSNHKVGTKLLRDCFYEISKLFGWNFCEIYGKYIGSPPITDVVFSAHSMIDLSQLQIPYVGVHVVRDPRDIIVSGYLYHKRCQELWCISNVEVTSDIVIFPSVPYSQEHRSRSWKLDYIQSLNRKSYQQNLQNLSTTDGLMFEMNHYGEWTIENMRLWGYDNKNILEIKLELLMSKYDDCFNKIFNFIGFTSAQKVDALHLVTNFDLNRMSDAQIKDDEHISSREIVKWQKYFTPELKEAFKEKFGSILIKLGYEQDNDW